MTEKAYWSAGNQIYFLDGWSYGILSNLTNVCLGTEEKILKSMSEGTDNPVLENILRMERSA